MKDKKKTLESVRIDEAFLKKELKKGTLFIFDTNLDRCPKGWFDCIQYIIYFGIRQNENNITLFLKDEELSRFNDALGKKNINLIILPKNGRSAWQLRLAKVKNDSTDENEICFLGGSMFRKYLDEKNIFYISFLSDSGSLLSASNLKYLKNKDDRCDIPVEENYVSNKL